MVVLLAPRSEIRGGKQSESAIMCRPCLKNEPAQIARADACSPLSLSHDLRTGNFHAWNYRQHPSSAHSRSTLRDPNAMMKCRHDTIFWPRSRQATHTGDFSSWRDSRHYDPAGLRNLCEVTVGPVRPLTIVAELVYRTPLRRKP